MKTKLILPDNNVFSELIKPIASQKVLNKYYQNIARIGLAITVWHELQYGEMIMPVGKRRNEIFQFLMNEIKDLPLYGYSLECAEVHAKIRADCRKKGKTLGFADSQIASIALVNNAVLVTRNVDDFIDIDGLMIENWFDEI